MRTGALAVLAAGCLLACGSETAGTTAAGASSAGSGAGGATGSGGGASVGTGGSTAGSGGSGGGAFDIGAPCTADDDCEPGESCLTNYPGGYCTIRNCEAGCPDGTVCLGGGQIGSTACFLLCDTQDDCRDDQACCGNPPQTVCGAPGFGFCQG